VTTLSKQKSILVTVEDLMGMNEERERVIDGKTKVRWCCSVSALILGLFGARTVEWKKKRWGMGNE